MIASEPMTEITFEVPTALVEKLREQGWPLDYLNPEAVSRPMNKLRTYALRAVADLPEPHTLAVGDIVLEWANGLPPARPWRVTGFGEDYALVRKGTRREFSEHRRTLDGCLVQTPDGREVRASWPKEEA